MLADTESLDNTDMTLNTRFNTTHTLIKRWLGKGDT